MPVDAARSLHQARREDVRAAMKEDLTVRMEVYIFTKVDAALENVERSQSKL